MRQVKPVLVALALVGVCSSSYANEPTKLPDGPAFTGVEPSSIQEDSLSDSEKEDSSADNALKEYGPLTICADRAIYDGKKRTLTYFGNVFVILQHFDLHALLVSSDIINDNAKCDYFHL
jgi:hypothetical protein